MSKPVVASSLRVGAKYNWRNQPERLAYMGIARYPGDRRTWHQFEQVDAPGIVWCEVLEPDLERFEESVAIEDAQAAPVEPETLRGWLIEHSGAMPGVATGHVTWLGINPDVMAHSKGIGLNYKHDAFEGLLFVRRSDAERVLEAYIGLIAPTWYSEPFSVTEHEFPPSAGTRAALTAHETKIYPDGTVVTGPGPLPEQSPTAAERTGGLTRPIQAVEITDGFDAEARRRPFLKEDDGQ